MRVADYWPGATAATVSHRLPLLAPPKSHCPPNHPPIYPLTLPLKPPSNTQPAFPTRRDGGIEGVLNHEAATLESARAADVYATDQPQAAFHARIAFCMDVHNEVGRVGWALS